MIYDEYAKTLFREYIELVDAMRSGLHDKEEIDTLSSQRQIVHDELIKITGIEDRKLMYRYSKEAIQ